MDIFYFGCLEGKGHFLHRAGRKCSPENFEVLPWGYHLDGQVLERAGIPDNPDGRILFEQREGWTLIAFWDRSVDRRHGSNSAFLVPAIVSLEELLRLAREQWPQVMARLPFELWTVRTTENAESAKEKR